MCGPAYMGLIRQVDDWLGRLFDHLKKLGRFDDTLIFFTADHGDFLGDHWLGEKEMFYEEAQRVPFIVYDPDRRPTPRAARSTGASSRRSTSCRPVSRRWASPPTSICSKGRSLLPLLRGAQNAATTETWRDAVFSELDYSFRTARLILKRAPRDCRAIMVRTDRWKYVWWQDFRPMLFDLVNDPRELRDLGADPAYANVRREMAERLAAWVELRKIRVTADDAYVEARTATHKKHGIFFGEW